MRHKIRIGSIFLHFRSCPSCWVVALLIILFVVLFVRFRLLSIPLERDEGEYAYVGQLILQGIPPYKLAYSMKLPGTYAAYAVIMTLFGQTIGGIHIGLIVVNLATILLVFLLSRRLFDQVVGVVAAGAFALMSLSDSVYGLAAHATNFVTLFGIAGVLLTLRAVDSGGRRLFFWCGLMFGLAVLMKQAGVFFGIFGGLFLLGSELRQKPLIWSRAVGRGALFSAGAILPLAMTCVTLAAAGVWTRFWFWAVAYAKEYGNIMTLSQASFLFTHKFGTILKAAPGVWLLSITGLGAGLWLKETRRRVLFILCLLLASFAAVCPGFYFREHYFVMMLPAAAILAGIAISAVMTALQSRIGNKLAVTVALGLFLLAVGQSVLHHKDLFFKMSPKQAVRALYGANPFPESLEIARYIDEHSTPKSQIAVIGSEPQIYFYSRRHSATGYIYAYPFMEPQPFALAMQREMIQEIVTAQPEYIVFVNVNTSWLMRPESDKFILEWFRDYKESNLDVVGLADIQATDRTEYRWDEEASVRPLSRSFVQVFRRRDPK